MAATIAPSDNPYRTGDDQWNQQSLGQQGINIPPQQTQQANQGGYPSYNYPPQTQGVPPTANYGMQTPPVNGYGQQPMMQSPPMQSPPQQGAQQQYFPQGYQQPQAVGNFGDPRAACNQYGHMTTESFGVIGIILAIIFFPIGLICCFADRKVACTRCGQVVSPGWSG